MARSWPKRGGADIRTFRYSAGNKGAAWMSESRKNDLETAVENAGGHALEIAVIADEDRFEVHFLLDARDSNEAFREGEKVMRVISDGGFWQGTSGAGFGPGDELAP